MCESACSVPRACVLRAESEPGNWVGAPRRPGTGTYGWRAGLLRSPRRLTAELVLHLRDPSFVDPDTLKAGHQSRPSTASPCSRDRRHEVERAAGVLAALAQGVDSRRIDLHSEQIFTVIAEPGSQPRRDGRHHLARRAAQSLYRAPTSLRPQGGRAWVVSRRKRPPPSARRLRHRISGSRRLCRACSSASSSLSFVVKTRR